MYCDINSLLITIVHSEGVSKYAIVPAIFETYKIKHIEGEKLDIKFQSGYSLLSTMVEVNSSILCKAILSGNVYKFEFSKHYVKN